MTRPKLPSLIRTLLLVSLAGAATQVEAAKLKGVSILDKDYLVVHLSDGDVTHEAPGEVVTRYTPVLSTDAAGQTANWTLSSSQDASYGVAGKNPLNSYRKTKLSGHAQMEWAGSDYRYEYTYEHWIFLRLPTSLKQGMTYTLAIASGVNSDTPSAAVTFDVYNSRSEAVHVNLVGYAPDAPHKAADLYQWMGSGGARDYSSFVGNQVSVYNVSTGATTAVGTVAYWMASGNDVFNYNLTRSAVWNVDFSSFTSPGTYRLVVAGVGCSQDFKIASDAYAEPFKLSVKGYFYMRIGEKNPNGISPPPRTPLYIPDESPASTKVYLTTMHPYHANWDGLTGGDNWDAPNAWAAYRKPGNPTNANARGGHSDAADWDRHLGHVVIIYDMLLPYLLTNGAISDDATGITESSNGIPDIIDEARNEVEFWLNLRDGDGYSHGLTNPNTSNELFQAGPTAIAAWANAANAAMLADAFRVAGQATLMAQYRDAAIAAFNYANTLPDPMLDQGQDLGGMVRGRDFKMMAAAYLYNVTGNQAWETVVNAESVCASAPAALNNGSRNQVWASAAYLMTPQTVHFPTLRANMKTAIIAEAKSEETNLINSRPSRRATDRSSLGYFQMAQNVDRTILAHAVADSQADRDLFRKALALEADWGLGRNPLNIIQMTAATTPLASKRTVPESYTSGSNDGVAGVHPGHTPYFNLDDWDTGMVMGSPSKLYAGSFPIVNNDFEGTWPIAEAFFPSRWVWAHTEFTPQQTMTGKMALYGYLYGLSASSSTNPMLSVTKIGTGSGTVTSSPSGIDCGADCNESYASGTSVALTATPGAGSTFTGWGGACTGTGTCTVSMTVARTVTASFDGGGASILTIDDVSAAETSGGVTSITFTVTRSGGTGTTTYALTVAKAGTGTGTVTSAPSGISCGTDCSEPYDTGTNVTLTAAPGSGSLFTGWSGACTGTGTCSVTMSAARSVTATFNLGTLNALTVTKSGTGAGTVTSDPAGISCGTDCSESYPSTSSVTLTATPNSGSTFGGWSGACSGTGACIVAMSAARAVTATFTVSSTPIAMIYDEALASGWQDYSWNAIIDFAGTSPVKVGTRALNATLQGWGAFSPFKSTALSTAGYASLKFWVHGGTGSNKVLDVTVEGQGAGTTAVQVTAVANTWTEITISLSAFGYPSTISRLNFFNNSGSALTMITFDDIRLEGATGPSYALTVTKAGTATGTVTSVPAGISCGSDCSESYPSGWSVTLTASVTTGSAFGGWSGACTGTGTCTVTMDAAKAVTATFNPSVTYTLSVTKSGAGVGGVTSSPAGVSCGSTCSAPYDSGTVVTLSPSPAAGSTFTGWSGACTGTGTCTVTMSAARSVTAGFSGGTTVAGGLRWVGRVDASNANAVRFAWQGAGFVATVTGTTVAVNLQTTGSATVYFQSLVDGVPGSRFEVTQGAVRTITLASGLAAGSHVVELYRETEGMYGVSIFSGFAQGTVTGAPAASGRVVEVVGDSISAGYGNLGVELHPGWVANPACHWTAENSTWFQTYAAVAGRACGADVSTVARSGWGMYRDNTGNTSGVLSTVYENAVGTDEATVWGFNPQASVVIINLGTNDYAGTDPGVPYETAYIAFVQDVRAKYPNAWIFLTIGSMLGDTPLAACKAHLANVVTALGDPKVVSFDLGIQPTGSNGEIPTGCDWHPNVADHARMAAIIRARLQTHLGW